MHKNICHMCVTVCYFNMEKNVNRKKRIFFNNVIWIFNKKHFSHAATTKWKKTKYVLLSYLRSQQNGIDILMKNLYTQEGRTRKWMRGKKIKVFNANKFICVLNLFHFPIYWNLKASISITMRISNFQ